LGDVRHVPSVRGDVRQCDQGVGLSAAILRIQPENRAGLSPFAGDATAHTIKQAPEAFRRVCVGEECGGVLVLRRRLTSQHLRQIGSELGFAYTSTKYILARYTDVEQRLHRESR